MTCESIYAHFNYLMRYTILRNKAGETMTSIDSTELNNFDSNPTVQVKEFVFQNSLMKNCDFTYAPNRYPITFVLLLFLFKSDQNIFFLV